jgi:potassium-transporting ATPase ATP-binding subunit
MFGLSAKRREKTESVAPGKPRRTILAKQLWEPRRGATYTLIASTDLAKGDCVLVETGDVIPGDGEILAGAAWVGETAGIIEGLPVLHEVTGDHVAVTGGSVVRAGWLVIRITAGGGQSFRDS